ncbi:MAG: hypothetical protein JSR73_10505 [Proteobacteria bacterium]|nr:hypothetical protein [Pseudomonadota bacterium]
MSRDTPRHEPRPGLFDPTLARFALSPSERLVGRLLVRLARVPGAVRLLKWWHARGARG